MYSNVHKARRAPRSQSRTSNITKFDLFLLSSSQLIHFCIPSTVVVVTVVAAGAVVAAAAEVTVVVDVVVVDVGRVLHEGEERQVYIYWFSSDVPELDDGPRQAL